MQKNFLNPKAKAFARKFLTVTEKPSKIELISLSYDVNDHVYSKSKSIYLCTNLVYIAVTQVLTFLS